VNKEEVIAKLKDILLNYEEHFIKCGYGLHEHYLEIKKKLQAIEHGKPYQIVDVSSEAISCVGRMIGRWDRRNRGY